MDSIFKNVLIVDDSEADHCMVGYAFEDYDESIQLLRAYDGLEALETLTSTKNTIDLILLDINMPRMNAFEFLDQLEVTVNAPLPPVVVQSTTILNHEKKSLESHPCVHHFVDKPVTEDTLEGIFTRLKM